MPVHDWTRVDAGKFHHFHGAWIVHLSDALNAGRLPAGFYALAEQRSGLVTPDVLTFQAVDDQDVSLDKSGGGPWNPDDAALFSGGNVATLTAAPPPVRLRTRADPDAFHYARRRRTLTIRRNRGDRLVAMVEIVSAGNKDRRAAVTTFVEKAVRATEEGVHLVVADLLPPGPYDTHGMHGAIWDDLRGTAGEPYVPPSGQPLTLASYLADDPPTAFVEPLAVGDTLLEMPLFLDGEHYVPLPLEKTYVQAYRGVPARWRTVVEGGGPTPAV